MTVLLIKAERKLSIQDITMAVLVLLDEAFELIASTTIQGVFFGIVFALYFLCTQLSYRQYRNIPSDERRKLIFSFSYNSVMMLTAGLELATETRLIQLVYIDHGGVHREPLKFQHNFFARFSALRFLVVLPLFVIGILNPLMQVSWVATHY
jgi:hypothetical protein